MCTNRLDYITRFVAELQVGTVNVREVPGYRLELTPFGGIKDSGLGYKEGVQEAMKSFTNVKDVFAALGSDRRGGAGRQDPAPRLDMGRERECPLRVSASNVMRRAAVLISLWIGLWLSMPAFAASVILHPNGNLVVFEGQIEPGDFEKVEKLARDSLADRHLPGITGRQCRGPRCASAHWCAASPGRPSRPRAGACRPPCATASRSPMA